MIKSSLYNLFNPPSLHIASQLRPLGPDAFSVMICINQHVNAEQGPGQLNLWTLLVVGREPPSLHMTSYTSAINHSKNISEAATETHQPIIKSIIKSNQAHTYIPTEKGKETFSTLVAPCDFLRVRGREEETSRSQNGQIRQSDI